MAVKEAPKESKPLVEAETVVASTPVLAPDAKALADKVGAALKAVKSGTEEPRIDVSEGNVSLHYSSFEQHADRCSADADAMFKLMPRAICEQHDVLVYAQSGQPITAIAAGAAVPVGAVRQTGFVCTFSIQR